MSLRPLISLCDRGANGMAARVLADPAASSRTAKAAMSMVLMMFSV
jgi:hypothetical protein